MALSMTVSSRQDASSADVWIRQIAAGEQQALNALYEATHSALYGYILSIVKHEHDAQDILHDCYLAVVRHAATYDSQGKPMAWIYTIARNLCLQKLRNRRKEADRSEELLWTATDRPDLALEERAVLSVCMNRLSEQERQIVLLHVLSGFRHREIAQLTELPLSTVLSKYHRALQKMKRILEKESSL